AAFALMLSKRSEFSIAVVEHADALVVGDQPNQRVVALGDAATDLLDEIGIFNRLEDRFCYPYQKMFVWDQNTDGELCFAASEYQRAHLGHITDSLQCTFLLQEALLEAPNIDVYFEFSATSLNLTESPAAIASAETTLTAQLIVAADGNRSWVRQQAKIFAPEEDYGQHGIVARISTAKSHEDTAWQRFLATGPLAVLPLAANQSSIVWSADNDYSGELMQMPEQKFAEAVAEALDQRLGSVNLLSQRAAFPLKSRHAEQYFKTGLALIGDAAHSIHPLAGQGANLGFKDAVRLVQILEQTEPALLGDISILEKYQRGRKLDNQQTDFLMGVLHRAYRSEAPLWLTARGVGMNWLSASGALKKLLALQAMGS
ncbi:MAG: 2-octaprenyl-3-methyl-6-methoxy-1,4-benzoquinol hydroxylase, partial [Gammaproteobacteria bacterium]|nr:2-octaprenyl-3-methyl-6-methoxy-1,4-benzoquinol hydroxylase [Gammaproteobacteria bacterium]